MEENIQIENYLFNMENYIMTNEITAQEFIVYYQNIKLLILNNKLTDPTFHLQILYDSEVINSLSFNNERMVYEMKKEIEELLIKLKEKNKKVRKNE